MLQTCSLLPFNAYDLLTWNHTQSIPALHSVTTFRTNQESQIIIHLFGHILHSFFRVYHTTSCHCHIHKKCLWIHWLLMDTWLSELYSIFSVRCNIYISHLCYDVSVRLSVHPSVMDVHWRIIDNFGFKFRSKFTAHCGRGAAGVRGGIIAGRVEGSSRAMLATEPFVSKYNHIYIHIRWLMSKTILLNAS